MLRGSYCLLMGEDESEALSLPALPIATTLQKSQSSPSGLCPDENSASDFARATVEQRACPTYPNPSPTGSCPQRMTCLL